MNVVNVVVMVLLMVHVIVMAMLKTVQVIGVVVQLKTNAGYVMVKVLHVVMMVVQALMMHVKCL